MPWKAKDARRFSKSVEPRKWAKIANEVLRRTMDEALAVKVANAKAKRRKKK